MSDAMRKVAEREHLERLRQYGHPKFYAAGAHGPFVPTNEFWKTPEGQRYLYKENEGNPKTTFRPLDIDKRHLGEGLDWAKNKGGPQALAGVLEAMSLPGRAARKLVESQTSGLEDILGTTGAGPIREGVGNVAEMLPYLLTANPEFVMGSGVPIYHGSVEEISKLKPALGTSSEGNLHGPGLYTTEARDTAKHYASGMGMNKRSGLVYKAKAGHVPLYDLDKPLTEEEANKLVEVFQYHAKTIPSSISDIKRMQQVTSTMNPKDLVGRSLAQVQDYANVPYGSLDRRIFQTMTRGFAEEQGYRGFTHMGGGGPGGEPHKVRIFWYPNEDLTALKPVEKLGASFLPQRLPPPKMGGK